MLDQRSMKASKSRSPGRSDQNYAAVTAAITYVAFVLKIVTGLVICSVILSTASFVMNGLNLREKKESRAQLMQEIIQSQAMVAALAKHSEQQRKRTEQILDEVLHVKDDIEVVRKLSEKHRHEDEKAQRKVTSTIHDFREEMNEKFKDVRMDQEEKHIVTKKKITGVRKDLEASLKTQESRRTSSMDVLTKRMFYQSYATNRYVDQRAKAITRYISIVSQEQNKALATSIKDVISTTYITYERLKNTYLEKSRDSITTLGHKIKASQIILRSEITSTFQYLATSIDGVRKSLHAAIRHEIHLGSQGTASLISAEWNGIRSNINTLGIVNEQYYKSTMERFQTNNKVIQSLLDVQTGKLQSMEKRNLFDLTSLLKEQNRLNSDHKTVQLSVLSKLIKDQGESVQISFEGLTTKLDERVEAAKKEVIEHVKGQANSIMEQNLATRSQFGNKIIGLTEHVTARATAICKKVNENKKVIDAIETDVKTDGLLDMGIKANKKVIDTIENDVKTDGILDKGIKANKMEIDTIKTRSTTICKKVNANKKVIDAIKNDVKTDGILDKGIKGNKMEIDTIKTRSTAICKKVNANKKVIDAIETDVKSGGFLDMEIEGLTEHVTARSTAICEKVNANKKVIDAIETDVKSGGLLDMGIKDNKKGIDALKPSSMT